MSLPLAIITLDGLVYDDEVSEAYLISDKGPLGIFPGYVEVTGPLAVAGGVRIKKGTEYLYYELGSGAYYVKGHRLKIIAAYAKKMDDYESLRCSLEKKGYNCPLKGGVL